MKLLAAGCSLIYGSELSDERPVQDGYSNLTFPALLARDLNLEYLCCARPGYASGSIAREVITNLSSDVGLVVINWTFADRFEFYFPDLGWRNIKEQFGENPNSDFVRRIAHYRRALYQELTPEYSYYNYLRDIVFVQELLKNALVPYVFTSVVENMLDKEFFHQLGAPQKKLYDTIDFSSWFFLPGRGDFLSWCADNNFPLGPNQHPLEKAHQQMSEQLKNFLKTSEIKL